MDLQEICLCSDNAIAQSVFGKEKLVNYCVNETSHALFWPVAAWTVNQ